MVLRIMRRRALPANPDWLLDTCKAIVASKKVRQFVVGITTNPTARRSAYMRWAKLKGSTLEGFVILDWNLSHAATLKVEEHLFNGLVNDPGYGVLKMHYHPSVKKVGGQSVYLAWWPDWIIDATE
jgi:hypothetical protein